MTATGREARPFFDNGPFYAEHIGSAWAIRSKATDAKVVGWEAFAVDAIEASDDLNAQTWVNDVWAVLAQVADDDEPLPTL